MQIVWYGVDMYRVQPRDATKVNTKRSRQEVNTKRSRQEVNTGVPTVRRSSRFRRFRVVFDVPYCVAAVVVCAYEMSAAPLPRNRF